MANMLSDTTGRRITGLREREDMTLDELAARSTVMCWWRWHESSASPLTFCWV